LTTRLGREFGNRPLVAAPAGTGTAFAGDANSFLAGARCLGVDSTAERRSDRPVGGWSTEPIIDIGTIQVERAQ
jgi:hypothetical protein